MTGLVYKAEHGWPEGLIPEGKVFIAPIIDKSLVLLIRDEGAVEIEANQIHPMFGTEAIRIAELFCAVPRKDHGTGRNESHRFFELILGQ